MARLNPAQHRLFHRHVDRAVETLKEGDRLLKGLVTDLVDDCIKEIHDLLETIELEDSNLVSFALADLPKELVQYLENPFAQAYAFNRFCEEHGLSHTRGTRAWEWGAGVVAARNLIFLPPIYGDLWESGELDKTRLVSIANRNLTDEAYLEVANLVRTRRKEDVDAKLLKMPASALKVGRRGPEQALEAAEKHGWAEAFVNVEIAEDLVKEAKVEKDDSDSKEEVAALAAMRALRAGLAGAKLSPDVEDGLRKSPAPMVLVERFLAAHKQAGDADPTELTKTMFYAHAGPMQKLVAEDKLLLRHFRPVKTQKRGQLFYRLLEVIEEGLLERQHLPDLDARGISELDATYAVRHVIEELNSDPNRFLVIPDEWLGEVTRRHLYFGSRTRKDGAAYKWFRKIGLRYFLGGHKTQEELDAKAERKAAKQADT